MPSNNSSENKITQEQKSDFYGDYTHRFDQKSSHRYGNLNLQDKDKSGLGDSGKSCIGFVLVIVLYSIFYTLFRFWFTMIYFG
jgi:hypothetical protein